MKCLGNLNRFGGVCVVRPFVDLKRSRYCGLVIVSYLILKYMIRSKEVITSKKVLVNTLVGVSGIFYEEKERNLEGRFRHRGFNVKDAGVMLGVE